MSEAASPSRLTIQAAAAVIDNSSLLTPAHLTIEDGVITRVATTASKAERHLDLKDGCLLPGFTNAHCHLELTDLGPLPRLPFVDWIRELIARKERLTPERRRAGVANGIRKLLESGVTTVIDHVSFDTSPEVYKDAPIRVIAFGETLGIREAFARETKEALLAAAKTSPVPFFVSPHSVHAVAPAVLSEFAGSAQALSLHLAESREETEYFLKRDGELFRFMEPLRPERWHDGVSGLDHLARSGAGLHRALVVHGNELSVADIVWLRAQKNVCVVHCPGSSAFFGHASFPRQALRDAGIPVALGTDSLASNTTLNFLDELRAYRKRFPEIGLFELIEEATRPALCAIGVEGSGTIAEGQRADVIGFSACSDPERALRERSRVDVAISAGRVLLSL